MYESAAFVQSIKLVIENHFITTKASIEGIVWHIFIYWLPVKSKWNIHVAINTLNEQGCLSFIENHSSFQIGSIDNSTPLYQEEYALIQTIAFCATNTNFRSILIFTADFERVCKLYLFYQYYRYLSKIIHFCKIHGKLKEKQIIVFGT